MHVTPGEVQALQGIAQLHGGSLTRNPETGLAEAGFLENILPAVVGIGASFIPGVGPLAAAGIAGAAGYGMTGSLEKGLMSGLGAFGGASALAGLGDAGAGAAGATGAAGAGGAGAGAGSIGATGASQLATTPLTMIPPSGMSSAVGIGGVAPTAATTPFSALSAADKFGAIGANASDLGFMGSIDAMGKGNLLMAGAPLLGALSPEQQEFDTSEQESYIRPQSYDPVTQTYTPLAPIKSTDLGSMSITDYKRSQGYQEGGQVQQRYEQPVRTVDPAVQEYNQMLMNQARQEYVQQQPMTGVAQLTPSLMAPTPAAPAAETSAPDLSDIDPSRKYVFDRGTQSYLENPNYADPNAKPKGGGLTDALVEMSGLGALFYEPPTGDTPLTAEDLRKMKRYGYYNEGGIVNTKSSAPSFQAGGELESDSFIVPADVVSALGNGSTDAGVDLLNQYIGMAMPIEGEGDGLSDDVPASIEGEQPARVADGEVYIPSEIVAMLGQGDPEMGSAKLYTMMDKIREAAHGKKSQQKEVKPESVMPA